MKNADYVLRLEFPNCVSAIFHFSLFTNNHVVWLFCCLVVLLIERNPNRVSAIFHSSLFTLHFSLKKRSVTPILHSSLFTLHLIQERAVAQEFAEKAGRRNLVLAYRLDVSEELAQAVCLIELVTAFRHLLQQWLCLRLDDGKLEEHGGIEHGIRILLIREYPLVFAPSH